MLFVNSILKNNNKKQDKRYILGIPQTSQGKKSFHVNLKKKKNPYFIFYLFAVLP